MPESTPFEEVVEHAADAVADGGTAYGLNLQRLSQAQKNPPSRSAKPVGGFVVQ